MRMEGFVRFAAWEATHPPLMSAADAVAAVGALYELLPAESRYRAVDPTGIQQMHAALRHLR